MNWFSAFTSSLKVDKKEVLGSGSYGVVYRGTFKGNAVAVKVIVKVHSDDALKKEQQREMEEHLRLDHENVLKLLHVDDSRAKTCLVLELCAGTLTDYCEKKYNGPMPPDGIVLYQIANGLHYIHSRKLVHRDVKPDNILISMTTPVQMKLSDFGFVKKTSSRGTYTQSKLKGTLKWMAPEILDILDNNITEYPRGKIQSDTFAAGCVFFYFLTRGKHPFGSNSILIQANILGNNPKELSNQHNQNLQGDDLGLYELIGKMVKPKEDRISLPDVIKHLTTNLTAPRQFKRVARLVREGHRNVVSRFHPKKPVLACGVKDEIIFFSAENSSIPFSNWKENEKKFQIGHSIGFRTLKWNADGTQLAAIFDGRENEYDVIVCWSYPSGEILFQKKLDGPIYRIDWNPFRPNLFATFSGFRATKRVFFFNSCPAVDQRPFHFNTIDREKRITSFQWISENRVALGLFGHGGIEIWEIDESTTRAKKLDKRFEQLPVDENWITDMAWDERTKCLAACSRDSMGDVWMTIWSMDSDQPIHATKVDSQCQGLVWRPNGKPTVDDEGVDAARKSADNFILVCGMEDGRIVIWTPMAEEHKKFLISQHSRYVWWPSFSPDGRFLASADDDGKFVVWSTENWEPVYIDKEEISVDRFSWLSSSSTDVLDYKLTFNSYENKVHVVEYAVVQSENPSKDRSETEGEEIIEISGVWLK